MSLQQWSTTELSQWFLDQGYYTVEEEFRGLTGKNMLEFTKTEFVETVSPLIRSNSKALELYIELNKMKTLSPKKPTQTRKQQAPDSKVKSSISSSHGRDEMEEMDRQRKIAQLRQEIEIAKKKKKEEKRDREEIKRNKIRKEKERFERDLLLAQQLYMEEMENIPKEDYECPICMEMFTEHQTFHLLCSHSVCRMCIKQLTETAINDGKIPTCPQPDCKKLFSESDIAYVVDLFQLPGLLGKYQELMLRVGINSMKDALPCPTPGCKNWTYRTRDLTHRYGLCPECDTSLCLACGNKYHHCGECENLEAIQHYWDEWLLHGRAEFHQLVKEQTQQQIERQEVVRQRIEELRRDEAWKQQHVRLCPSCGKGIERLAGCSSMVCGRDAHGGNIQSGCGTTFNWNSARPYEPKIQPDIYEPMKIDNRINTDHQMECTHCFENIRGLRFQCIHCPYENICLKCEETLEHDQTHTFIIHSEKEQ